MKTLLVIFILSVTSYVTAQTDSTQQLVPVSEIDTVSSVIISDSVVVDSAYANQMYFDSSIYYTDTIIQWMSFEEAVAAQKQNPKKVMVDIYATWCRWCRQSDSLVFTNRDIAHFINQHYYPVKFNAETRTPVTFRDVTYSFIKDESVFVHELTVFLLNNKLSYPGTVFLDEEGNIISSRNGYMDAPYFEVVLNYYASQAYKYTTFYNYEFDFIGKVVE